MLHAIVSKLILLILITASGAATAAPSGGRENIPVRTGDPYLGAIAIDADSGAVIIDKGADVIGYPASVVKLMDLYIVLERVAKGQLTLQDQVLVTAESAGMGGSQVFLKENEVFTVDELLYALMIQSANDAATALALHVAGTREGFVQLMNAKAKELGMESTSFGSVHGLPPAAGQRVDVSSPRDLACLGRALATRYPDALRYTATTTRGFRGDSFTMRSHNNLLGTCNGVDGLKTGYFRAGGFSIVATATRNGRRVVAVILGSPTKQLRDPAARDLLAQAFASLPPPAVVAVPQPAPSAAAAAAADAAPAKGDAGRSHRGWWVAGGVAALLAGVGAIRSRRSRRARL